MTLPLFAAVRSFSNKLPLWTSSAPKRLLAVAALRIFAIYPLPAQTVTVQSLYNFTGKPDGANPQAGLTLFNNRLFGTTTYGGHFNSGVAYSLIPSADGKQWTEHILHVFTGSEDGAYPESTLQRGTLGTFYGTTYAGGSSALGTAFALVLP